MRRSIYARYQSFKCSSKETSAAECARCEQTIGVSYSKKDERNDFIDPQTVIFSSLETDIYHNQSVNQKKNYKKKKPEALGVILDA